MADEIAWDPPQREPQDFAEEPEEPVARNPQLFSAGPVRRARRLKEVHMCGEFDCGCPTTAEFARIIQQLQRHHEEQAALIVQQLLDPALHEGEWRGALAHE